MKRMNVKRLFAAAAGVVVLGLSSMAQADSSKLTLGTDAGLDIYSSYVWRGAKFGTGAAFQPWAEFSYGGLAFGSWGSVSTGGVEGTEMDLYLSYSTDMGLGIAFTDYYFGTDDWTNFATDTVEGGAHFFEPSISFESNGFSILGGYMFGAGVEDTYIEVGYSFGDLFSVAIGAGNGAYTSDGEFTVCNVTLSTSKEIEISSTFSLPLSAGVTLNPSTEAFNTYVGISF